MIAVDLMEFNKNERKFDFLREVKLSSVPTSGDKIVIDIDGESYVFKVYDVHFADDEATDVNVIRLSTFDDYGASGFPDII